jgi:PAS domain S-box-containing protein
MPLPVQYFQKLVESCPDIIISVDRDGTITFYNDGARQNLGFTPEEVLGQHVVKVYSGLEEARRVMAAMRAHHSEGRGRLRNFETIFKTKRGEQIPVAISASIIYDEHGRECGSIGFAKDIREIRQRDRLATLYEIAVGMSHEINNSLEVLVNQVEMLQKYVDRVATDEDYIVESDRLEAVASQIKKIQDITERIAEMADEGEYGNREYLSGRMMTDLRANTRGRRCERPSVDARYPLSGLRVLIVDDDAGICQSLRDLLEEERCCVETAPSAARALEILRHNSVDFVLSDVVMPDMDGYKLYQAIKESTRDLPVVLMTAFNYDKDHIIKRSSLEGLQGAIFKKPVNPALLKTLLLKHCRPESAAGAPSGFALGASALSANAKGSVRDGE